MSQTAANDVGWDALWHPTTLAAGRTSNAWRYAQSMTGSGFFSLGR
jgi:hypothetical protein